jgi:hypothetical protein
MADAVDPAAPPAVDEPMTLADHEALSQARYSKLAKKLKSIKGNIMADAVNVYGKDPMTGMLPMLLGNQGSGTGAAIGGGLGAGLLGGVLGGALLGGGNGGLFGNRNGDNGTAAVLTIENAVAASERLTAARFDAEAQRQIQADINSTAAATQLAGAVQSSAIAVELAKGQGEIATQAALNAAATQVLVAKSTGDVTTQAALNAAALGVQVQKTAGDTQTQVATQTAAITVQNERTAAANALATAMGFQDARSRAAELAAQAQLTALTNANIAAAQLAATQYTLATAIKADGDLTRGLIIAQNETNLNRMLTTAQNEIIELRGDRNGEARARATEINVTQNVNQATAVAQQQQQQQQQAVVFANLTNLLGTLVNQNQTIHNGIVNLGTMTASGNPTSANTRVN